MNKSQTFEEFINTYIPDLTLWPFLVNLLLTGLLCYGLSLFYIRFGRSMSNRATLGRTFLMIGMTTMLIITVVKASLALSLGLVGALSIIRFRTAVKEPEELAYLFLTISVGLGLGAGQRLVTLVAFAIILLVLWLRSLAREPEAGKSLFVTVTSEGKDRMHLNQLVGVLKPHCSELKLKRFDESNGTIEALFEAGFDDFRKLEEAADDLRRQHESVRLSFLQSDGL